MAIALLVCVALGIAPVLALRRFAAVRLPVTTDWIDELSVERYRPMLRLLNDADLQRLSSCLTPDQLVQFRRQRCQIFRGYLRSLSRDFKQICAAIKILMLQAGNDRPDLAALLTRSQIAFAWGMALVQARLALYSCGIGRVEVANLLTVFDGLKCELQSLAPAHMTTAA